MKKNLRIYLKDFLKVSAAGASVFGIAFAFGIFDSQIEVQESNADIIDFFGPKPSLEKFSDSLERLGHAKPRTFDLNGNVVYFSHAEYRDDPDQVMFQYQREFRDEGINSKVWTPEDAPQELMKAALTGEIVPMQNTGKYVSMIGMTPRSDKTDQGLKDLMPDISQGPAGIFKGHRHVEITKKSKGFGSEAIATFSDDNFDYKKMEYGYDGPGANPDAIFPACVGCVRLTRFSELNAKAPFTINSYESFRGLDATKSFYAESMAKRGWQLTETSSKFESVRDYVHPDMKIPHQLQFSKGGNFVNVLLYDNEHGNVDVHGTLTY